MKNVIDTIFNQSKQLDLADEEQQTLEARRLNTYSVEALRIAAEADRAFVLFPNAVHTLKALDRLFQLGTEFTTPQGMYLVGPSGVGKTATFNYFQASLPKSALFSNGSAAIGMRLQSRPKVGHLIQGLLRAVKYPFSTGSGKQLYLRRFILFEALKSSRTRLIWLDEAQHLLFKRPSVVSNEIEGEATEFLRELIDVCNISVVLAGTDELDRLSELAPHLASRISVREEMKCFQADINWIAFVRAFARNCQSLDLSYVNNPNEAMLLHLATAGNLRAFKRLLTEVILISVDSGKRVNQETLSIAFQRVFGMATMRSNPFV